jgi:hypothetical protein
LPVRSPFLRSLVAFALAVAAVAPVQARAADPPTEAELAQARERFGAARKLEDAGRWSEALTLLQRVAEVRMTPQVRFHIALSMENVGLWAQAMEGYKQAAGEAVPAAPEVVKEASEHLRKLEALTPVVTADLEGGAPGDELLLDGRAVVRDDGTLRVDPGAHTLEVRRGHALVAREVFAVEPRARRRVALRVGAAAPAPAIEPGAASGASGDRRAMRLAGWSAIGVGAASAVLTGVFLGLRAGALGRLDEACPGLVHCPASVEPIVHDGKTDARLVNVFGAIGAVTVVTGGILLLTGREPAAPVAGAAARLVVAPLWGRSAAGLVVAGAF